jgi:hypothetical protein
MKELVDRMTDGCMEVLMNEGTYGWLGKWMHGSTDE